MTPCSFSLSLMSTLISYVSIWPPKIAPIYSHNSLHISSFTSQDISLPWSRWIPVEALPSPPPSFSLTLRPSFCTPLLPPLVGSCTAPLFLMFQQNSWESRGFVGCFQEQSACCIIHHSLSPLSQRQPTVPSWDWGDRWGVTHSWVTELIQGEQVNQSSKPHTVTAKGTKIGRTNRNHIQNSSKSQPADRGVVDKLPVCQPSFENNNNHMLYWSLLETEINKAFQPLSPNPILHEHSDWIMSTTFTLENVQKCVCVRCLYADTFSHFWKVGYRSYLQLEKFGKMKMKPMLGQLQEDFGKSRK